MKRRIEEYRSIFVKDEDWEDNSRIKAFVDILDIDSFYALRGIWKDCKYLNLVWDVYIPHYWNLQDAIMVKYQPNHSKILNVWEWELRNHFWNEFIIHEKN